MAASSLVPYNRNPLPVLAGASETFTNSELQRISDSMTSTQSMVPQASTKAPAKPLDGMIRLARDPWRPVSGQTADAFVYFDGAGKVWRYLSTAPTNT